MPERIRTLDQVAEKGNIDEFYQKIENDVKLLEHIDELPFVQTPLHISASAGHIPFSLEMMKLKPSFINKPNPDGHSPIHLALLNGHTETVCQLLQHNADLVRVKGRECMTPLHYAAAQNDNLALLEKFLSVCPDSITDVTTQNETALHIALKYDNLEAFKFLVGWLLRKWPYWRKIMELKDVEGKTILHTAVSNNQTEAVNHILGLGAAFFNVNEKNLVGQTALDILKGQEEQQTQGADISERLSRLEGQEGQRRQEVPQSEMRVILERAGALTASSLPTVTSSHGHYLRLPRSRERKKIIFIGNQVRKRISDEKRNALLVVAALLVTVTYQAILSPPGGLWQDDLFKPNTTTAALSPPSLTWVLFKSNSNITAPHRAGSAIAKEALPFVLFVGFNSMIFLSSIAVIVFLVPPGEIVGLILAGVSIYLIICYFCSLLIIAQAPDGSVRIVFFSAFIIFVAIVAVAIALNGLDYLLNLIWKVLKYIYSRARSYCN